MRMGLLGRTMMRMKMTSKACPGLVVQMRECGPNSIYIIKTFHFLFLDSVIQGSVATILRLTPPYKNLIWPICTIKLVLNLEKTFPASIFLHHLPCRRRRARRWNNHHLLIHRGRRCRDLPRIRRCIDPHRISHLGIIVRDKLVHGDKEDPTSHLIGVRGVVW